VEFRTRKIIKPGDLNPLNTLFGGRLLEWVDEECAIYCACQLDHNRLATKFMSEINFLRPARQNEVIEIGVETVAIGRTSITARCEVREKESRELILAVDKIVFVALNSKGRPIVHRRARELESPRAPAWVNASWPKWLGRQGPPSGP
jgi:acyl-CoA thioesterase YciA